MPHAPPTPLRFLAHSLATLGHETAVLVDIAYAFLDPRVGASEAGA
ncbi:hypothetical protein [Escherichia coli]|nr:hypothetical protein [Escherichia coli]